MNIGPFPVVLGDQETNSPITYQIFSDGIYIKKKVMQGYVTYKVDEIKGLPEGEESINVLPKKIPINFFWTIVDFFRYVSEKNGSKIESYIEIGYNPITNKYFLFVPNQEVSRASVKRDPNEFKAEYPDCYIVAEFHCHSGFKAYFSSTDNNDSKRDMFSGVIGYEDKCIPEYKIRFCCSGKFWDCELDDLFSNDEEYPYLNYKEALSKIQVTQPKIQDNSDNNSLWDIIKYKMNNENLDFNNLFEEGCIY